MDVLSVVCVYDGGVSESFGFLCRGVMQCSRQSFGWCWGCYDEPATFQYLDADSVWFEIRGGSRFTQVQMLHTCLHTSPETEVPACHSTATYIIKEVIATSCKCKSSQVISNAEAHCLKDSCVKPSCTGCFIVSLEVRNMQVMNLRQEASAQHKTQHACE